jgi:hypothetical protein
VAAPVVKKSTPRLWFWILVFVVRLRLLRRIRQSLPAAISDDV